MYLFYRSNAIKNLCVTNCNTKETNPEAKIYDERTIELGIVTDKYLWDEMKVIIYNRKFLPSYILMSSS